MSESATTPRACVIIPTYNRCEELGKTLETLTEQDIDPRGFEVIVADDGSSDRSADVARSFAGRLRLKYCFQEDEGFRAGAARNAGARLATAPILIFLDSGTLAGPQMVSAHLAVHAESDQRRAVMGYCYGYNAFRENEWKPESFGTLRPAEIAERYKDNPLFADIRERDFSRGGSDPMKWPVPWLFFYTMNCSVPTEDFWAVGGFEEMFRSWGAEDVELGYRLYHNGSTLILSRDAWTIEMPRDRPVKRLLYSLMRNGKLFLDKHREPYIELMCDAYLSLRLTGIFEESYALERWTRQARELDVHDEIEAAVAAAGLDADADTDTYTKLVIFGCGPSVPAGLPPAVLADFDADLLARALSARALSARALSARALPERVLPERVLPERVLPERSPARSRAEPDQPERALPERALPERAVPETADTGYHAIGLRTPLPSDSADVVIVTSRLSGLWDSYGERITQEATRIGRRVILPPLP